MRKSLSMGLLATGLAVATVGCTTTNPYTGESEVSGLTKGGFIGGASGALIGGLAGGETGALIGAAAGVVAGGAIGYHYDAMDKELRQYLVGTGVQVQKTRDGVQLVMASDITFAFDSASLKSNIYQALNSVALVMRKYGNTVAVITGYTDNVGNADYNQRLSERRATSVGDYLSAQGVSSRRIVTKGYGERRPIASNETAQGRAMNRRVVISLRGN